MEEGDEEAEEGQEAEEEEGQEEEKKEEEGREVPGRQAAEGRSQEQGVEGCGQEDCGGAEEEGHWSLRHQDALRRPRRDLRQEQDGPPGGGEGALGVHLEEQAQQGPHHHAGREAEEGPAGRLVEHVQDGDPPEEAHQVSAWSRRNLMTFRRCRVCTIFDPWT